MCVCVCVCVCTRNCCCGVGEEKDRKDMLHPNTCRKPASCPMMKSHPHYKHIRATRVDSYRWHHQSDGRFSSQRGQRGHLVQELIRINHQEKRGLRRSRSMSSMSGMTRVCSMHGRWHGVVCCVRCVDASMVGGSSMASVKGKCGCCRHRRGDGYRCSERRMVLNVWRRYHRCRESAGWCSWQLRLLGAGQE